MGALCYTPVAIERALSRKLIGRVRHKIGGSHTTVTYPALDSLSPMVDAQEFEESLEPVKSLNLYFHIAFCEFICRFCHYSKTFSGIGQSKGDVNPYLRALFREIDNRQQILEKSGIDSIYIGGGTPTVLSVENLEALLKRIAETIQQKPRQYCVETSPLTMATSEASDKLELMKSYGVNRFSVGVQSFDDRILRKERGHCYDELMEGLRILQETDCELNIDLIQDLPNQSSESLRNDIKEINDLRPHQVTWYIMRPEKGSAYYKQMVAGNLVNVPSSKASAVRRYHIIRAMRDIGYTLNPGNRFVREKSIHDAYKSIRNGLDTNLLAFGVSGYSHISGRFFRNISDPRVRISIDEYVKRMATGRTSIDTGSLISSADRRASQRITGIRKGLDPSLLEGDDIDTQTAKALVEEFLKSNLLVKSTDGLIGLTDAGRSFEEEITSLFYARPVIDALKKKNRYWVNNDYPILQRILDDPAQIPLIA